MKNIYKTALIVLVSIFGTLLFQGCATSNKGQIVSKEELHVEVTYLERKLLPPNAKVTLILEDISKQDVKSKVLAKQSLVVKNAPPYTFTLSYDTNSIDFKHAYNLSAYITVDGKYIYRSDAVFNPFSEIREKYVIVLKRVPKED